MQLLVFFNRLKIFIPMTVMGLCILITINIGGNYLQDNASVASSPTPTDNSTTPSSGTQLLFSSIDKLSISNVPNGSMRLVYPLIMPHSYIESQIVTEVLVKLLYRSRLANKAQQHIRCLLMQN